MKRILLVLAVMALLLGAVYGSAASLSVDGGAIQAGVDTDLTCDDAVEVWGWGLSSMTGLVEYVRIGDVSTDCAGKGLQARITLSGTEKYITGPKPAGHDYEVPILGTEPAKGYYLYFKDVADNGALISVPAVNIVRLDVFIE